MGQVTVRLFSWLILRWRYVLAGVLAAGVFLGLADLLAWLSIPASSPLVALGSTLITVTPSAVQEFAISTFGGANKAVLYVCMAAGGTLLAAGIGLMARWRIAPSASLFGVIALALGAVVGGRPETSTTDLLPTAAGACVGLAVLIVLSRASGIPRRSGVDPAVAERPLGPSATPASRRSFLVLTTGAAVVAAASLTVGRSVGSLARTAQDTVVRLVLPEPARRAASIPAEAQAGVEGVQPFITPNDAFYRIDTALAVPEMEPDEWIIRIHGLVEQEVTVDMNELLELPLEEHHITLTCVSNPVGGDLLGTARWLGYPVRNLLSQARPLADADMVLSRSVDGFTASTPLEALTDQRDSLLAVGMNGEPLPRQHGYPARLVVPGLYGYVSATKWVTELEVTRFDQATAYWTDRGWDEKAPVLVSSRIDVPSSLARVEAGDVVLAGSAWAQQDGIDTVEVRVDDGEWKEAELASEVSVDTWRQWRLAHPGLQPGRHVATVRAATRSGTVQTAERRDPIPNAATGQHRVEFVVE